MHTKLILLNIHLRILIFNPYIIFQKKWNSFINFMSNKYNPPYIMLYVVFKMHQVKYPDHIKVKNHEG